MAKTAQTAASRPLRNAQLFRERTALYGFSFFCLVVIYILLAFLPLPDAATLNRYNLDAVHYRWLVLPIIIFLVVIWLVSFYGALRVKAYANLIENFPDGRAFNAIGSGFMILALSLPFTSTLSSIVGLTSRYHPGMRPVLTVVTNYISLAIMAAALLLIASGADKLSALPGSRLKLWPESFWVFLFIVVSSFYVYFLVGPADGINIDKHTLYLPHWLLLISMSIPYLYIWYRGLRGAHKIFQYQKNVRGWLYKSALRFLAIGIAVVVASSVITRILTTVTDRLSHLHLMPILIIIYGLLLVMALGYFLVAIGARKLRKIEEV